jgi:hypothetical protein
MLTVTTCSKQQQQQQQQEQQQQEQHLSNKRSRTIPLATSAQPIT